MRAVNGFLAILGAYVVVRVWQWGAGEPDVHPDSASYVADGAVSLLGHSYRPWGITGFYALFPDNGWRVFAQCALSTLAWALLAWALWRRQRSTSARLVAAGLTLLLAVLPPVAGWDFALLPESLSISLGVTVLACLLLWRETGSRIALFAVAPVAMWWTFVRNDMVLLVIAVIVAVSWWAWRRRTQRIAALTVVLALLGAVGWSAVVTRNIERQAGHPYSAGGSPTEEQMVYRLGRSIYKDSALELVFTQQLGLPSCPGLARQAREDWHIRKIPAQYVRCPELQAWVKRYAGTAAVRLALTAPWHYARTTAPMFAKMQYGSHTNPVMVPPPLNLANRVLFPKLPWVYVVFPVLLLLAAAAVVASGAWRHRREAILTALALLAAAICSQLVTLTLVVEGLSRYGSQEAVMVRLALVVAVAAAIDSWRRRSA